MYKRQFDDPKQPDHQYFYDGGTLKRDKLKEAMIKAYVLAFAATDAMGKGTLVPSPIGSSAFRPKEYPSEADFIEEMVKPAIEAAKTQYRHINVEPLALYDNGFVVPSCFFEKVGDVDYTQELDDKVFINAWDPWSALGNGNFGDRSADGWWGRSTAISLLGWPMSNPKMRFVDASATASAALADAESVLRYAKFRSCYKDKYAPPLWVCLLYTSPSPRD